MRRPPQKEVPYFLARRLRKTEVPKPRFRLRYVLEVSGFVVAVAAALVAYFELSTVRQERLTPYRAVIFTSQFESYRELVRLRDKINSAIQRNEIKIDLPRPIIERVRQAPGRAELVRVRPDCLRQESGLSDADREIQTDMDSLAVALVTADAIWPDETRSRLGITKMTVDVVRLTLPILEMRAEGGECEERRRDLTEALTRVRASLDESLTRMRQSLRFDQINSVPQD
jgi:hypothetical protein